MEGITRHGHSLSFAAIVTIMACCWVLHAVTDASPMPAVDFVVHNPANGTAGGKRFKAVVGNAKAAQILESAYDFIKKVLKYHDMSAASVTEVVLTVDADNATSEFAAAYTVGGISSYDTMSNIHLSATYVASIPGNDDDIFTEVKGVLYHESVHVWQWNGNGTAPPSGLIEGIADFVRLEAGLAPSFWAPPGVGDSWDQGYSITAYFLQYCNSLKSSFVSDVNAKLAMTPWRTSIFHELLGKSVDQLWSDYKAKYSNTSSFRTSLYPMHP